MGKIKKRWIVLGVGLTALIATPLVVFMSLSCPPAFYQCTIEIPKAKRQSEAKKFVAQGLQLRNDIVNEPKWEAAFSDEQVNAWLAEDLMTYFADQVPQGVREPRVAFENDQVSLGFELDEGPIHSVVWIVARVSVPEGNTLAITLEKIRAGMVPFSAERFLGRITEQARRQGLDLDWERDGDRPMAIIHYAPTTQRRDVVLERIQVRDGEIRLAGRSDRARGKVAQPALPTRRILQSKFPRRSDHAKPRSISPVSLRQSSASPTS
ncbi:MAG: hypothetical protein ABI353_18065 [Isosphaeraceae bacterium]